MTDADRERHRQHGRGGDRGRGGERDTQRAGGPRGGGDRDAQRSGGPRGDAPRAGGPRGGGDRGRRGDDRGRRNEDRGERSEQGRRNDDRSAGPRDGRDRRPERRGPASPGIAPIVRPRRLDLTLPASEPLGPREVEEMREHLAFIRSFKGALRLSLNAAEDLLVNGARPPADRGVCRHLLSKIDRACVERAVSREPLAHDPSGRARLLAGVIRILPEQDLLLRYLDTLTELDDRRDAARALAIAIDRIDFATIKSADLSRLLGVIAKTFEGHERTQALFGLLDNESLARVLPTALAALDPKLAADLTPLIEVHRAVFSGVEPSDEEPPTRALIEGLSILLAAPDAVLRGHPEEIRARLLALSLAAKMNEPAIKDAQRRLLDSLPKKGEDYSKLRIERAEQMLAAGELEPARALINELANAHPDLEWARRRAEALRWPRTDGVTVSPGNARLRRGFWLQGSCFAWVKLAPVERAGRAVVEAKLQADLHLPRVAPVLAHGMAKDGTAWIAIAPRGEPRAELPRDLPLPRALELALDGVAILRALAVAGVELPDFEIWRLFFEEPLSPMLVDLEGASAREPGTAAIAHGPLAAAWCRKVLEQRTDLHADLAEKVRRPTPLVLLAKALIEARAKL